MTGAGQVATPLVASEQAKGTVTFVLFQPAAFGGGLAAGTTPGGVLSMLRVTEAWAVFPARSMAVPVTT